MHHLVYDCDNTMGIPGRDIDDGLALLYLLGRTDVHLEAITTTFGNGSIEEVSRATERLFDEVHIEVPLFRGAASASQRISAASRFLAGLVADRPGQVSLLATGALTNLAGAWELDPRFFERVREVVIMGGLTEPLLIRGRAMAELNLTCDPEAARLLLAAPCPVTVVTGNLCLQVMLERRRYRRRTEGSGSAVYRFLKPRMEPWFAQMEAEFGIEGFYPWDVVAAVRLTDPPLFSDERESLALVEGTSTPQGGFLLPSRGKGRPVSVPRRITRTEMFWQRVFEAWERVAIA